jgi:hypothetical protein
MVLSVVISYSLSLIGPSYMFQDTLGTYKGIFSQSLYHHDPYNCRFCGFHGKVTQRYPLYFSEP